MNSSAASATWPGMPLLGRTVVVTRAADQAGPFVTLLESIGATVIEVPVIRIVPPTDGGAALRSAVTNVGVFGWVVLTSPNAAERFFGALAGSGCIGSMDDVRVACVGPGTAAVVREHGGHVDLVAARSVGEGLVEAFPVGSGRILLPRAAQARNVVPDGLRSKGWDVDEVEAYRTEPVDPDPALIPEVHAADVVAFTSSSTVRAFAASLGIGSCPPIVVSIGPETTATLREFGVQPSRTADPHTLGGLVQAIVDVCR